MNLSLEVQAFLEEGKIEMGHARSLLTLEEADQIAVAQQVIAESLSVRQCEALASSFSAKIKPQTKSKKNKDPNTAALERELSEILGSPVDIKYNAKGKGKLVINFKNLDALQGVLDKIKS